MKKLNLILLAGGEKGPLYDAFGYDNKAFLPVHGKPMLDWVIEAFWQSGYIDRIVVVGPKELETLYAMRFVDKRLDATPNVMRNIMRGVSHIRWTYYRGRSEHEGYVISFCDAVFLTAESIAATLATIVKAQEEFVLHYVEKETYAKHGIRAERTYIPVEGKHYTGSTIYYLRRFSSVMRCLPLLTELRNRRKDPEGMLSFLNLKDLSLSQIKKNLSERLGKDVGIYVSDHPELGMDVDKKEDYALAETLLVPPWRAYEKIMIVVNPNAGAGSKMTSFAKRFLKLPQREDISTEEAISAVESELSAYGINYDIMRTASAGHASELAAQAVKDGYEVVVAVGGDGTVNEVANGLIGSTTALAVIPLGSANLLALDLGLPVDIKGACRVIAEGHATIIDTGKVNERVFVAMAGIGFDAHVLRRVDGKLKRVWGMLSYALIGVKEILRYPFGKIGVRLPDGQIRKAYYAFIQNGKSYASGFSMAPTSRMDDGVFELVLFSKKNIFVLLFYLIFRAGNKNEVSIEKITSLEILGRHCIQLDGDYVFRAPAKVTLLPKSLHVLTDRFITMPAGTNLR